MKRKIVFSLLLIAVTLSVSCIITILEFDSVTTQMERLHANPDEVEQISSVFYRNLLPAIVSLGAGVVLLFMLGYFIIFNYIRPLEKMAKSLEAYNSFSKAYNLEVKGNDILTRLNKGISLLAKDNTDLQTRISQLKDFQTKQK